MQGVPLPLQQRPPGTIEQETVVGYGWWDASGLETAGEVIFPAELPRLLRELTS